MTTAMAFRKEPQSEACGKLRPWIERQVRGEGGVRGDRSGESPLRVLSTEHLSGLHRGL